MQLQKLTAPLIEVKTNYCMFISRVGKLIDQMITNHCIFNIFSILAIISTLILSVVYRQTIANIKLTNFLLKCLLNCNMVIRLHQILVTSFNVLGTLPKVVVQLPIQFTTKIFGLNFCFTPPHNAFP